MRYAATCATLAVRGIDCRFRKILGVPAHPKAVTITITRRCNSRCVMCNIWRMRRKADELSLEEIVRFLKSPGFADLIELDLTGGEPFLREDFPLLIEKVCELSRDNLRALKTVALATNGLRPDIVVPTVKEVLRTINCRFDLAIVCSVDGQKQTHDTIRGTPGGYEKVMQTITGLRELRHGSYPLWLGIKTTILPLNWQDIPHLVRFAERNELFHILSPVLFTENRFRNINRKDELDLLPGRRRDLIELYLDEERQDYYYPHVLRDSLKRGKRRLACSAGLDHFFVEGDGRVFPCPVISRTLGNVKTDPLEAILGSGVRRDAARKAGRLEICRNCFEPGCIRFSQSSEGWGFLGFVLSKNGAARVRRACFDEGLGKYF